MNGIENIVPCMKKAEIFQMPNVIIIGKARRNSQLTNGAGVFWGELYRDGTLEKLSKLPRIINNSLVGWTGDCCDDENIATRDFTYMIGAIVPYDTPIPEGFDYRVLHKTLVIKGLHGQDMSEVVDELTRMGYTTSYGDNNGWNAELYIDGEPDEDKWSWLVPIK